MPMTLCDLRLVPGTRLPYMSVEPDKALVLTVKPSAVIRCPRCPNSHVCVLERATPASVRELAQSLELLALELEQHDV